MLGHFYSLLCAGDGHRLWRGEFEYGCTLVAVVRKGPYSDTGVNVEPGHGRSSLVGYTGPFEGA